MGPRLALVAPAQMGGDREARLARSNVNQPVRLTIVIGNHRDVGRPGLRNFECFQGLSNGDTTPDTRCVPATTITGSSAADRSSQGTFAHTEVTHYE